MMKRSALLFALALASPLWAQVGVNTETPESMFEVKGDIKVGSEEKTDAQGKAGMIRWNAANACFEGHDGERWRCLDYKPSASVSQEPLVVARGDSEIRYNNKRGWDDYDRSDTSVRNIIKFTIVTGEQPGLYDTASGVLNIREDGLYRIDFLVRLYSNPPSGEFNGESGDFAAWLTLNNKVLSEKYYNPVYRGRRVPGGGASYDSTGSQVAYLKKGNKIHLRFLTYWTENMNADTNNIYIDMKQSVITLTKL